MMNDQPNILFLIADHHRWDWLSCDRYGIPVRTPNIDALASRGMLFDQCRCTSPLCAPSRASLATGLRPHRTGVFDNDQDLSTSSDTFMKRLRDVGYRVAACGKTDLHKATHWDGLDGWTARMGMLGFTECIDQAGKFDAVRNGYPNPNDPYMAYLRDHGLAKRHHDDYGSRKQGSEARPSPLDREHYTDDFCGRSALKLIDNFPGEGPWFLQVNFPGPHDPYDPPAELWNRYEGVTFDMPVATEKLSDRDHQAYRRAFGAMIEGIDEWVGRIIEAVEARGQLDNTLIVYSSDHGEMLGDHGLWDKQHPHDPSVRVPLVIAGPNVQRGKRSSAIIELSDLAALFVDLAGQPVPPGWDARSFLTTLRGELSTHRQFAVSMQINRHWRLITDGQWKLVVDREGARLFDLEADPLETRDFAAEHDDVVKRLRAALRDELNAGRVTGC